MAPAKTIGIRVIVNWLRRRLQLQRQLIVFAVVVGQSIIFITLPTRFGCHTNGLSIRLRFMDSILAAQHATIGRPCAKLTRMIQGSLLVWPEVMRAQLRAAAGLMLQASVSYMRKLQVCNYDLLPRVHCRSGADITRLARRRLARK